MIPGDCGTHDLQDEWNFIFQLVEIPEDVFGLDTKSIFANFNVKKAEKNQHQYY